MNYNWSLRELYDSFECVEYINDLKELEGEIANFIRWSGENLTNNNYDNSIEKLTTYIETQNKIGRLSCKLYDYGELVLSTDSNNDIAMNYVEAIEDVLIELSKPETQFSIWIKGIENISELIEQSEILKEHAFFLNELKMLSTYTLSEQEEILIAKLAKTGSMSWVKFQDNLLSNILVDIEIDGKKERLPLPMVRNMAYEKDAMVRKNAYECELVACEKASRFAAFSLNGIKGEVLTLTSARGFMSTLDMTVLESRLENEILSSMLDSINELLPKFRQFYKKKAELLGHSSGLPFYDLFAPIGESNLKFTYEEALDFVVAKFSTFSKKLGDYAANAAKNRWIDVLPKVGKRGGAFCQNLHEIKESRILLNFTGSFNDVLTLAHELGHGYHGSCLYDEQFLNSDYPMPIAETASTFCENLVTAAALKNCTKEEAITIMENDISSSGQVIVDILSRFIFERNLFELRKKGSVSKEKLCALMVDAQKQTYGDGLDQNYLHKYMWVVKPHYYDPNYNFYNFPYAFGQLFTKGLYAKYLKDGDSFVSNYDKMLAATGKLNLKDVAKIAGVDIADAKFWKGSCDMIGQEVDKFLAT